MFELGLSVATQSKDLFCDKPSRDDDLTARSDSGGIMRAIDIVFHTGSLHT